MTKSEASPREFVVTLTQEERDQLLSLLEQADRTTNVEIHRTDALKYREFIEEKEHILRSVIEKLRPS